MAVIYTDSAQLKCVPRTVAVGMPVTQHPPGSRAGFLPPSPRRTTRASVPACRSSLANVRLRTRLHPLSPLVLDLGMALGREQDPVGRPVWAAVCPPPQRMALPARPRGDPVLADRTPALLGLPEAQHLAAAVQMPSPTAPRAGFQVGLPRQGRRMGLALDVCMPPHRHTTGAQATDVWPRPLWAHDVSQAHPVLPVLRPHVLLLEPPTRCVRGPPLGPLPPQGQEGRSQRRAGPWAGALRMRLRPTPPHRLAWPHPRASGGVLPTLHEGADRLQTGVHVVLGWRPYALAVLRAPVGPEASHAVLARREPGLGRRKCEPSRREQWLHQGRDLRRQDCPGPAGEEASVGTPEPRDVRPLTALAPRAGCLDLSCPTMQGQGQPDWRCSPALGHACGRRRAAMLVHQTGGEPWLEEGLLHGEMGQEPCPARGGHSRRACRRPRSMERTSVVTTRDDPARWQRRERVPGARQRSWAPPALPRSAQAPAGRGPAGRGRAYTAASVDVGPCPPVWGERPEATATPESHADVRSRRPWLASLASPRGASPHPRFVALGLPSRVSPPARGRKTPG